MKREKKVKKVRGKGKRKSILILIIVLVVVLVGIGIFLCLDYSDKKLLADIKKHYYKDTIVSRDTNLYNKNNKVVGTVKKGFKVTLEKKNITKSSQQYFRIDGSNYYVYYKDIKRDTVDKNDDVVNKYLVFNQNIKSKNTIFYDNGKEALKINDSISLPIQYMDDGYYYVIYLNHLLQIKKGKNDKLEDKQNTDLKETEYVSIINYDTIDNCNKSTCVSIDNVRQQFNYLKDAGFYSISIDEYKLWLEGKIRLKENAILLTSNNANDNFNSINNEYSLKLQLVDSNIDIKFSDVNKKSTKASSTESIERYVVKRTTTLENFQKMTKGEDVVEPVVTTNSGEQKIAVLNYHFFYDSSLGESCNESICLEVSKFREHLNYLRNNGYKTLKMEEFRKWMYGEIELPEKSVLITVDDGAMGTGKHNGNKLIPLLEEYDMNATLFLISGWWNVENYRSKNLDIQSHTYDMHQYGTCGRGQLVCATKEEALSDLQKSLQIVDNNNSFCFPFYSYSNVAIEAVKEAGFKIAFVGGSVKARRSNNKFLIPRYPIHSDITMDQFIKMVS